MEKQSIIKGTIILGFAGIFARVLGLFFRWPLIMLIGDEGIGYYQMSYPLLMFFVAMASGIPVAVSKMVAEKNAINDREGMLQVLNKALLLMIILGGGFTIFILTSSQILIKIFKWNNKAYFSLIGIALAPVFISIMSALRGFFQGFQNMNPTAISEIIEQLARIVVGVGLAYILKPRGIEYSAGGASFGAAAGGICGGIYLLKKYFSFRKEFYKGKVKNNIDVMGKLLYMAVPISLGATVGTVMSLIDSMLVPQKLLEAGFNAEQATTLYGQLTGKAFVLVNVPLTLSMALCASLVPVIAESYALSKTKQMESKIELSLRLSSVIAFPSFCGLYFMASPILRMIFPGQAGGVNILKYLSISVPFIIFAQTSTAILQGTGTYVQPVLNLGVGCIFKILITYFLVSINKINIYGSVAGTIAGYVVACILNMVMLKKKLKIRINYFGIFIKPAFASVLMIIAVVFIYINVYNITLSNGISCLISVITGMLVYLMLIIVFGVLKYSYIKDKIIKR